MQEEIHGGTNVLHRGQLTTTYGTSRERLSGHMRQYTHQASASEKWQKFGTDECWLGELQGTGTELLKHFNCPQHIERSREGEPTNRHRDSISPSQEEVHRHILRLKNNIKSRENGIVVELLTILGPHPFKVLTQIIAGIWTSEKLLDDCKCTMIHPLIRKGDSTA